MKKFIFVLMLFLPVVIFADEPSMASGVSTTAQAREAYDGSKYPFGDVLELSTTVCAHKNTSLITVQDLNPIDLQGRWYFKIKHKDNPKEVLDVIGLIEYTKKINNENYYFYGVPLENKGNLLRFTDDGAYMRNLKFPIFSFVFLDVELDPQLCYLQFPLTPGKSWAVKTEGIINVLGMFKVRMKTTAKFNVMEIVDVPIDGRMLHVYKIEYMVTRGNDGKIFREEDWFGAGVGLMYSDTETYILELQKYVPGPDNAERFNTLTVPIPAQTSGTAER